MHKKKLWQRPLVWTVVVLMLVSSTILVTDFLRWQMVRGIFWRPAEIKAYKKTVVIIDPMYTPPEKNLIMNPAYILADYVQQLADVNIDIIHYPDADIERVKKYDPVCLLISGQTAPWTDYSVEVMEPVFKLLRETTLPVLGICGGHQLIAQAYGAPVAPMGYQELGYIEVALLDDDPIFEGLESPATVFSWHSEEVKDLPDDFVNLGSTDLCGIQIFRHTEKDLYGVQFHPELRGRKPDGEVLVLNFFNMAGVPLSK